MIERTGNRLVVTTSMTMDHANALLDAGKAAMQRGEMVIDLSRVAEADSSAVALMLGWLRAAKGVGAKLRFEEMPAGVRSLAELYGVAELLPSA